MTWEEREIVTYLKGSPKTFYSAREIARRAAGKRIYLDKPHWAKPFLPKLVEKGILETDPAGHYRIRGQGVVKARGRKWVSPSMARLLKQAEKDFSDIVTIEIVDDEEEEEKRKKKKKEEEETDSTPE